MLLIIVFLWGVCSVFAYGISFAYWQGEFPISAHESYASDRHFSLFLAIVGGPVSLCVVLFMTHAKHGLKF